MIKNINKGTYKAIFITCFIIGIIITLFIISSMFTSNVPSGNICEENTAYLQKGVDAYKKAVGEYPTELKQLLETKQGKGPFVEAIDLKCPSDDLPYIIVDGKIQSGQK